MLTELEELQESRENVRGVDMSFDVETTSEDGRELVHRTYTFSHAAEWDKWAFTEYVEKRTPRGEVRERNWSKSRHVVWSEMGETRTIDVPPEVSQKLAEVTDADSVTIQVPAGSMTENAYDEFTYERTQ